MTDPGPSAIPLDEALSFLPDLRELDPLRRALAEGAENAAADDTPGQLVRIVAAGTLEAAIGRAEDKLREETGFLTSTYRRLLHAAASNDAAGAIDGLIALGDRAFEQSQYGKARAFFEAALAHALPLRNVRPRILALQRVGRVAHRAGDLADGLHHYQRSIRLAIDAGDEDDEIVARTGAGNVLLSMGRWDAADAEYRGALHRFYRHGPTGLDSEAGYLWANLAVVAKVRSRFGHAERYLVRARRLHESAESPARGLALCDHALAEVRKRQGRLGEAIDLCRKALDLATSPYDQAMFVDDLATYHMERGLTEDALRISRQAEDLAVASRAPYVLIETLRTRGNILRRLGDESGWVHFERALEIARRTGHRYTEAEVLLDYAPMREMIGGIEEAAAYREYALGLLRELGVVAIETAEGIVEVSEEPDG